MDNYTTDNSSVVVDTTALPLNAPSFFSSNDNGSYAKYGDNLTLRFTSQEAIRPPLVSIAGDNVSVTELSNGTSDSWEAVYQVKQLDNATGNFSISYLDRAGNVGSPVSSTASDHHRYG